MGLVISKIGSVSTANTRDDINWYRIKGTRNEPILEKIAVWAVASLDRVDTNTNTNLGHECEMIIGLPSKDMKVLGFDVEEQITTVAGYVELSTYEYKVAKVDPSKLPHDQLNWKE